MASIDLLNMLVNPLVKLILRSPLHHLLDDQVALIVYTGRKSGKSFSVPVNYHREGKTLRVVSLRNRTWWKNMRGGATVKVMINGSERNAWVDLIEDLEQIAEQLGLICKVSPSYANALNLQKNKHGDLSLEELLKAAKERVVLVVRLN